MLNREHVGADAVEALASLRQRLWARIADHVGGWTQEPEAVVVYGSAARGDGDTSSDIDLLVVRPESVDEDDPHWRRDLTDLVSMVTRWTGNPCEVLDRSAAQLRNMSTDSERLLAEIRRDGRALVGSLASVPTPEAA